ncbi:hypothetical protein ANCDUO_15889 [Ancylostoma duodenale]|uniref:Uncharacterized protein n=1 Tax=Ancylostoma duodenale TaxID=51022 RepID=A0A0C2GAN0_9BILA|nr:hypothetical protein ANCDUO_15889 [Ancylostoma duodenale]
MEGHVIDHNEYLQTNCATVAQIAYTAAIVFSGFNVVGSVKCSQLGRGLRGDVNPMPIRCQFHANPMLTSVWMA